MANKVVEELLELGLDRQSLRLLLNSTTIKKLPIKQATWEEIHKAREGWFFNPIHYYPRKMKPLKGEVGYDDKFRYILCSDNIEP